jgi:hypothetical protein
MHWFISIIDTQLKIASNILYLKILVIFNYIQLMVGNAHAILRLYLQSTSKTAIILSLEAPKKEDESMFFSFENSATDAELLQILHDLMVGWEKEVVEFKEESNDYDKNKIGQYFSAISNEANLKSLQFGWLIFGIRNKDKNIVGSDYRNTKGLDALKYEIAQATTGGISFVEIFEVYPTVDGKKSELSCSKFPLRPRRFQLAGTTIFTAEMVNLSARYLLKSLIVSVGRRRRIGPSKN